MKIPQIKKGEPLVIWRARLVKKFNLSEQVREILDEVSVISYIRGTNTTLEILKKEGRI